jgi:hypothetical protein
MTGMKKVCEYCQEEYYPSGNQHTTQKYCSISCKDKNSYQLAKSVGHIKAFKSGYPRQMSIRLYMQARNSDISCPCHYCGTRLYPHNFQLDHMEALPVKKLTSKEKWREIYRDESNLVVCCSSCNRQKAGMSYSTFKELKQNAKI